MRNYKQLSQAQRYEMAETTAHLITVAERLIMAIKLAILEGVPMKTSTIAEAKNNLSQLIHQLESDEPIHLTRHGKRVAVMLSEANYQKLMHKDSSLYQAIQ